MSRSVLISVAMLVPGGATAVEGRNWDGCPTWFQRGVPIRLREPAHGERNRERKRQSDEATEGGVTADATNGFRPRWAGE